MKKLASHLLFLLLPSLITSLCTMPAHAQFLGSFFSQQSTKKKLMAEQVAGYQLYLGAIKTAYGIADQGWTAAHNLKNGTFGLHSSYFSSLEQVPEAVKKDPKARAVDSLYRGACSLFANEKQWQKENKLLSAAEQDYLAKVSDNLASKSQPDLDELTQLLTPGKLQLTDAERLSRLDKLYERMKSRYAFAGAFTAKCRKLALNRQREQQDKTQMKKLYGLQ